MIPHELAVMAGTAAEILEPHGVTILEAARAFVARIADTGSAETFGERYNRMLVEGIAGKQGITRHTFASPYLAAYDEKATKQAIGHTAGSSTLFRHYRAAVTEAAGKKFFRDSITTERKPVVGQ